MKKLILLLISISIFLFSNIVHAQWEPCNNGLSGANILSVGKSGNNLLAGTDKGLYISNDDGISWTIKDTAFSDYKINTIVVLGENIYLGTSNGVYLSTNSGGNWRFINLLYSNNLSLLIIGYNILIGTENGVSISTNDGFNLYDTNLSNIKVNALVSCGDYIFAGTQTDGGVYISSDKGSTWIPKNIGLDNHHVHCLCTDGTNLFAGTEGGIYFSKDFGNNWEPKSSGVTDTLVYSIVKNGNNLYAGTYGSGIFLSNDNGENWIPKNNGLHYKIVNTLSISNNNIYAGTINRLYSSSDNGDTWIDKNTLFKNYKVNKIIKNGTNLFAGTYSGGIFLSTDNGNNWVEKNNGLNIPFIKSIAVNGNNIFAGTYDGLYLSMDNGDSWSLTSFYSSSVTTVAINNNILYVGNDFDIYKSTDNGETWFPLNILFDTNEMIFNGDDIFAIGMLGIMFSSNNGKNWVIKDKGIDAPFKNCIALNGNNIFVGTSNGIYLSTDYGNNWIKKYGNDNLFDNSAETLTISGNYIFAGYYDDNGSGVLLSKDNGNTWIEKYAGLNNYVARTIVVNGDYVYAGTSAGVFKIKLNDILIDTSSKITLIIKDRINDNYVIDAQVTLSIPLGNDQWQVIDNQWSYNNGRVILYTNNTKGPFLISINDNYYLPYSEVYTLDELKNLTTIELDKSDSLKFYINNLDGQERDMAFVQCPVTLTAEINDTTKFGVDSSGQTIGYLLDSKLYFSQLGDPMALILPQNDVYTYRLTGIGSGPFQFDIWKSLYSGYKHLVYNGNVTNKTRGWITLNADTTKNDYILHLDTNNDGNIDTVLYPIINITDVNDNIIGNNSILRIYPNPVQDILNVSLIQSSEVPKQVQIFDILGQQVAESQISAGVKNWHINLSGIPSGIYILKIDNYINKFMKL